MLLYPTLYYRTCTGLVLSRLINITKMPFHTVRTYHTYDILGTGTNNSEQVILRDVASDSDKDQLVIYPRFTSKAPY